MGTPIGKPAYKLSLCYREFGNRKLPNLTGRPLIDRRHHGRAAQRMSRAGTPKDGMQEHGSVGGECGVLGWHGGSLAECFLRVVAVGLPCCVPATRGVPGLAYAAAPNPAKSFRRDRHAISLTE
jgi:hypothetical protein